MFTNLQTICITVIGPAILEVALSRPQAANALSSTMAGELVRVFDELAEGSEAYRVIILTGEGRHFCAGADLKERSGISESAWRQQHDALEAAVHSILNCPLPVIAAVNGAAYGGGLELALACDFIYASPEAKFALTETTLGIMPGLGGAQTLARAIGTARAKELIFSGQAFSAEEAYRWGMINRLCDGAALREETLAVARIIAANAPLAVQSVKRSINRGISLNLQEAMAHELELYNRLLGTSDRQEGISAWNGKRKADFTGQ
jgi:enoyl-CoA hydratase